MVTVKEFFLRQVAAVLLSDAQCHRASHSEIFCDGQALPENHPWIALVLENYADLLQQMHRQEEAEQLQARAQAIRAKQQSPSALRQSLQREKVDSAIDSDTAVQLGQRRTPTNKILRPEKRLAFGYGIRNGREYWVLDNGCHTR
jgi:hypothetical protein